MTRSSASLPSSARYAAKDLVRRAKRAAEDAEDRLPSLDNRERWLRDDKHQIEHRGRMALADLNLSPEARTEISERTEAELREWKTATENLAADRVRLTDERRETQSRFERLQRQAESSEGLAPWDAAALEALRAWGDLPAAPAAAQALLKGADVQALFRERLGVARSTYYSLMRPLLRSYHLVPATVVMYTDGIARLHPGKGMRFRREEVDAVIAFIEAESAML
jgi:hypothetical protein